MKKIVLFCLFALLVAACEKATTTSVQFPGETPDQQTGKLDQKVPAEIVKEAPLAKPVIAVPIKKSVGQLAQKITQDYMMAIVSIETVFAGAGSKTSGTGFIVEKEPLENGKISYNIITNAHVIDNKTEQEKAWIVTLADESETFTSPKLLGIDTLTDIAVINIETEKDLPVTKFGNSSKSKMLEDVIAIGNTEGFGVVTTTGQINDTRNGIANYEFPVMQTDAATNVGNSGSPIFNLQGEVIGVHTFGSKKVGSLIGFEVLSERVQKSYKKILENIGKEFVTYPDWGIIFQVLPVTVRKAISEDAIPGAVSIAQIFPNSAAEKAGLKKGDLILSINGSTEPTRLERQSDQYKFYELMRDGTIGDKYNLEILSGDKKSTVTLTAGQMNFRRLPSFQTAYGFVARELSILEKLMSDIKSPGILAVFDNPNNKVIHDIMRNNVIVTHINNMETPTVAEFVKAYHAAIDSGDAEMLLRIELSPLQYNTPPGVDSSLYVMIRL